MKNILNFVLSLSLAFAVVSCKDKAASAADATQEAAQAAGLVYSVTPDAAKINWEGSKPTGKHTGTINITSGEITVKDGAVAAGNFVIDINSIVVTDLTGDDKLGLESHLKGTAEEEADHFFNAAKFPTGKFEIVSVTPSTEAGANAIVKGNLTLKDITKEVTIPANISITENSVVVTTNQFAINRTDFGINYGSKNIFKDLGDKFIDDNIMIQLMVEGKTAPAAAPAQ
jgi:polyisoprenoid-binding protein YceI